MPFSLLENIQNRLSENLQSNSLEGFVIQGYWQYVESDFNKTIQRLKKLDTTFARKSDCRQLRLDQERYHQSFRQSKSPGPNEQEEQSKFVHNIPFPESPKFWGRDEVLHELEDSFTSGEKQNASQSYTLYGMAGVGKTQVALRYANTSRHKFGSIFWVNATSLSSIQKSFREISQLTRSVPCDMEHDDAITVLLVKNWLASSSKVIYYQEDYEM